MQAMKPNKEPSRWDRLSMKARMYVMVAVGTVIGLFLAVEIERGQFPGMAANALLGAVALFTAQGYRDGRRRM